MAKEELLWLSVNDFSAGIVTNSRRASGRYLPMRNPGAATDKNTYRCCALPTGGLGPLPRRDFEMGFDDSIDPPMEFPGETFITGMFMAGPMNTGFGSPRNHELFVSIEAVDGTDRNYGLLRYELFNGSTSPTPITNETNSIFPELEQFVTTKFSATMSNQLNPDDPGLPVIAIGWYAPGPNAPFRLWQWPDENDPDTDLIYQISNLFAPSHVVGHQHRIVVCLQFNWDHGAVGAWPSNSYVVYSLPNQNREWETQVQMYAPENPANYGTVVSLSANELLLIKQANGGVMVRGDLDNPTITPLTNIHAADRVKGTPSRIGYVYAGFSGEAIVWAGGDSSQSISQQLNNFFYVPDDNPNVLLDERFVWSNWANEYIVTSNLYLYDIEGNGWWRLDNPDDLRQGVWAVQSSTGRQLYGACHSFDSTDDPIVYGWTNTENAHSWSWQGHPYRPNMEGATITDRDITIRQVLITGTGQGTITFTPILADGTDGPSDTVTFDSDEHVKTVRINTAIHSPYIHYRLEADGGENEAPVLHDITFGFQPSNQIPTEG